MLKKIFAAVVVVVLIIAAGAAYFFYSKNRPAKLGELMAAGFLPGDTIAFAELTDMQRSKGRWQETALHQIAAEPEVAAFLTKPVSLIPQNGWVDRFLKADAKEAFVAVTAQGAHGPKVVAGFDFTGSRQDAEALVTDAKGELKSRYPDGKSDLQQYGASQIETFTYGEKMVATVFQAGWFFAANDLDTLKAVLDRAAGKGDGKTSLRENETYKLCLAKLPKDADAVAYVDTKGIMESLETMLEATPNVDKASMDDLKKIQAVAAAAKMDGENMRDAFYVYRPGGVARAPLAFDTKAFTSPETMIYFTTKPSMKRAPALPSSMVDPTGMLVWLDEAGRSLSEAKLGFGEFKTAFGPEAGVAVDWRGSLPDWIVSVDVRDQAMAKRFVETLTGVFWTKSEASGVNYYQLPGLVLNSAGTKVYPTLALTDKALVYGMNLDSGDAVKAAVEGAKMDGPRIDSSADFKAASELVVKPTDSFGYIDSQRLFEKVYGLASPFLIVAAFSPANKYADFSKVPSAKAISKHLKPIVYSQSTDENGSLTESVGPVTFTEAAVGVAFGGGFYGASQLSPGTLKNLLKTAK